MTRRAALLHPWIEQAAISLLIREDRAEAERLLQHWQSLASEEVRP